MKHISELLLLSAIFTFVVPAANALEESESATCVQGGGLKSDPAGKEKSTMFFTNSAADMVVVSWVRPDGSKKQYLKIRKGTGAAVNTFVGHVWYVEDGTGKCLAWLTAKPGQNNYKIP